MREPNVVANTSPQTLQVNVVLMALKWLKNNPDGFIPNRAWFHFHKSSFIPVLLPVFPWGGNASLLWTWSKLCSPVSLWPLLHFDEQCKVLDIKFHAFQTPTYFYFILFFYIRYMLLYGEGWSQKESAFNKCREVRKRSRGQEGFVRSELECR